MLEHRNLLREHAENGGRELPVVGSFVRSFANGFRGHAGKQSPEAPMRSDVNDVNGDEPDQRLEKLQVSFRRAQAIIEKQRVEWEERRSGSGERPSESVEVTPAKPQSELPADWNIGLSMARRYAGELRKLLFNSCCQLQRDESSVNLHELWRVVALLRVAEKRERELADAVAWASSVAPAHDEQLG